MYKRQAIVFFLMIRRPPRSTLSSSSAASDVYKRQQQRVAIARAFACSAKILFADEPTGNLDPKNGEMVSDLLFEVNSETDNALVVVTHDHDLADRCDKKINLKLGKIVE